MSKRMEKFYIVKNGTRMCGLRYDHKKEELLICGPDSRKALMVKILKLMIGQHKFMSPFTQETRPCAAKLRITSMAVNKAVWVGGLNRVNGEDELELVMTTSFRRTCR